MRSTKTLKMWVKLLTAAAALLALAAVAAGSLAPSASLGTALLYASLGAVAGLVVLVIASVMIATIMQLVLKHCGTDTQWFWFNGEPRGLQQLRGEVRANSTQGLPSSERGS